MLWKNAATGTAASIELKPVAHYLVDCTGPKVGHHSPASRHWHQDGQQRVRDPQLRHPKAAANNGLLAALQPREYGIIIQIRWPSELPHHRQKRDCTPHRQSTGDQRLMGGAMYYRVAAPACMDWEIILYYSYDRHPHRPVAVKFRHPNESFDVGVPEFVST
jgi:hypothetical protein